VAPVDGGSGERSSGFAVGGKYARVLAGTTMSRNNDRLPRNWAEQTDNEYNNRRCVDGNISSRAAAAAAANNRRCNRCVR